MAKYARSAPMHVASASRARSTWAVISSGRELMKCVEMRAIKCSIAARRRSAGPQSHPQMHQHPDQQQGYCAKNVSNALRRCLGGELACQNQVANSFLVSI